MWQGRRDDAGQSTLEWLGVGAVVIAVLAALVLAAPGLGGSVADAFRCLVSQVTGGGACAATQLTGPDEPCVVRTQQVTGELGVKVIAVNVDAVHGYIVEELSDGTVRVTQMTRLEGGPSVSAGAGIAVNTGDGAVGGRARASLRGNAFIQVGDTWTFPDAEQADAWIENQLVEAGLGTNPVTGNPVGGAIARGALDLIGVGGNEVDGERTATRVDVGVNGEALAEAVLGPLAGEGRAALEGAGSVTVNSDGSVELGFGLTAEVAAALGLPVGDALGASAAGAGALAVTVRDGQVVSVEVAISAIAPEGAITPGSAGSPADVLAAIGRAAADPSVPTEEHVITLRLDTSDPALSDAAADLLAGLGSGQLAPEDVGALGDALVSAASGSHIINQLDGTDTYGVDAHASFIIGGRLAANVMVSGSTMVDARSWDPASGWQPWIACTGG